MAVGVRYLYDYRRRHPVKRRRHPPAQGTAPTATTSGGVPQPSSPPPSTPKTGAPTPDYSTWGKDRNGELLTLCQSGDAAACRQYVRNGLGESPIDAAKNVVGGWVGDLIRGIAPYAKIAAGGLGVLITGGALVFVAGRNQAQRGVGQAVQAAGTVARAPAPAVRAAAHRVRTARTGRRFQSQTGMSSDEFREAMATPRGRAELRAYHRQQRGRS